MSNKHFLYFILVLFQVTDGKSHKSFRMNAHVYITKFTFHIYHVSIIA